MCGREKMNAKVAIALWVRGGGEGDGVAVEVVFFDHGVLVFFGDLFDFGGLWSVSDVMML